MQKFFHSFNFFHCCFLLGFYETDQYKVEGKSSLEYLEMFGIDLHWQGRPKPFRGPKQIFIWNPAMLMIMDVIMATEFKIRKHFQ